MSRTGGYGGSGWVGVSAPNIGHPWLNKRTKRFLAAGRAAQEANGHLGARLAADRRLSTKRTQPSLAKVAFLDGAPK